MRFKRAALAFALLTVVGTGCTETVRKIQQERVINHLSRLESYEGVFVEKGALANGSDLKTRVRFAKPGSYELKVLEPKPYAGTTLLITPGELLLYYPSTGFAIRMAGIDSVTEDDFRTLISDRFSDNMGKYEYRLGDDSEVAGLSARKLGFEAKQESSLLESGKSWVYDPYSFPLQGEFKFRGGPAYSFVFDSIAFNPAVAPAIAPPSLPASTIISKWNLRSKNYTPAEAKRGANFSFSMPAEMPRGLSLDRIIRQEGPVPAFLFVYTKRPYFLDITAFKDYGTSLVPPGQGIRLNARTKGSLILGPHASSYAFKHGGTQYILVSNLPFDEIVAAAESMLAR